MHWVFTCFIAVVAAGCASQKPQERALMPTHGESTAHEISESRLTRLGNNHFPVSTKSPVAQQAFDRGLAWAFSFGHYAAEQEFRRAAEADPNCAMAYWGIALVNGPHINYPMVPPEKAKTAWEALGKARALAAGTTPLEQALIDALAERYADPQPEDRSGLDQAYASAMQRVWERFPENADVGALCAEALMDVHPWDLWTENGPQPWTPLITATLERVLELNPKHPGANHYYIHAIEASAEPGKALEAADRLGTLVPDSSHMVHMPSHIYARVGQWQKAAGSNIKAMKADKAYRTVYPRPGFYALYMAHNSHFLMFTAMMRGRSEEAIQIARQTIAEVPPDFVANFASVADGFTVIVPEVLMRFGRWEEILKEPAPPEGMPLARAMWHFTRTSALTVLNRVEEAQAEREKFLIAKRTLPEGATFGNNKSSDLLEIAALVLDGEMAAQAGKLDDSVAKLEQAVQLEDKLHYDEPPDWIQPVRHTLGAVLLRKGDAETAEKVYRADLHRLPDNGWSLMGLRDSLQKQGRAQEAAKVDKEFKAAWSSADVKPTATCYCQEKLAAR